MPTVLVVASTTFATLLVCAARVVMNFPPIEPAVVAVVV